MWQRNNYAHYDLETINWLRIIRSANINDVLFWQLLTKYKTTEKVIEQIPYLSAKGGRKKELRITPIEEIEKELSKASKYNIHYFHAQHESYPRLLKEIPYPPPVISIRGNIPLFQKPGISIVGSRKATAIGLDLAYLFANQIKCTKFPIISGMALGIDTAAHQGSLKGGTIAVLAGGLDYIYPRQNKRLYYEIIDNCGGIISDKPLGYIPTPYDFPLRNRIIAGLSIAMIVIEAKKRSGTLVSARLANEYNRLVFAVPQNPLDPNFSGNIELLSNGATSALSPQYVLDSLLPLSYDHDYNSFELEVPKTSYSLTIKDSAMNSLLGQYKHISNENDMFANDIEIDETTRKAVLEALSYNPTNISTIEILANRSREEIAQALLELELANKIQRHSNGNISLKIP